MTAMWNAGDRVVLACDCVAVVECRLPDTRTLHSVRIECRGCEAPGHRTGRRILASSFARAVQGY